jgi:hypothetical protein
VDSIPCGSTFAEELDLNGRLLDTLQDLSGTLHKTLQASRAVKTPQDFKPHQARVKASIGASRPQNASRPNKGTPRSLLFQASSFKPPKARQDFAHQDASKPQDPSRFKTHQERFKM